MHPRILFPTIMLSAISLLHGQSGFQPGYLIDIDRDTIAGAIEDRGEVENSKVCHFRATGQDQLVEYLPAEITGYCFTGGKCYVTRPIEMDGSEQPVFAECLVQGSASLYYVRVAHAENYFIEKEHSGMVALTNEVKEVQVNGKATKVYSKQYIRLLKALFSDCPEIQPSIDQVNLTHKSLISITCKYNEYVGGTEPCITYGQGSRTRLRVAPVIGFSSSGLSISGDGLYESFDFNRSNDPVLGLVLDLSSSRLGNHLSFQLGTEWSKSEFHSYFEQPSPIYPSRTTYYNASLNSISMKLLGGAKYNFTRGRVRPSAGGGLMFHKYIQPDFWYEVETHNGVDVTTEERHENPVGNWAYGAYAQAGLEVELTERMVLFAHIKGGYGISNPETIAALVNGIPEQIRVRYELIPFTFSIGLLF
jgi:hypothetical protein